MRNTFGKLIFYLIRTFRKNIPKTYPTAVKKYIFSWYFWTLFRGIRVTYCAKFIVLMRIFAVRIRQIVFFFFSDFSPLIPFAASEFTENVRRNHLLLSEYKYPRNGKLLFINITFQLLRIDRALAFIFWFFKNCGKSVLFTNTISFFKWPNVIKVCSSKKNKNHEIWKQIIIYI